MVIDSTSGGAFGNASDVDNIKLDSKFSSFMKKLNSSAHGGSKKALEEQKYN